MKPTGHDENVVCLEGVVASRLSDSGKALLCRIPTDEGQRLVWVPLSQISDDSEVYGAGDEGQLVVRAWWAASEGLE